jgi:putative membrane protein
MEQLKQNFNWEHPQRQPLAGLVIVFIKTIWEVLKRIWPFILLMLFNNKAGRLDKIELIAAALAGFTILGSLVKFFFFRFYILNEELIIKKGWLKKEVIVLPLQKIQTVHIEESFLHNALGIVKLSVDTAGSSNTEVTIDALRRPMAKALQEQLDAKEYKGDENDIKQPSFSIPILSLSGKDLLKLSLSANHVEAFFIMLSFGFGFYDNLRNINEGFVAKATGMIPRGSFLIAGILIGTVLIVTVLISTIRICLKFYGLSVNRIPSGFYIKAGLTNVKERLVSFPKIQFISWRANWIRKQLGLWILEYKIAGADEINNKMKVEVPVTRYHYISTLVDHYHAVPETEGLTFVRIHPSYFWRRLLLIGLLPVLILIVVTWQWWEYRSLFFLALPLLIGVKSFLLQRRFKLYADEDVVYLDKSAYGTERILLKWFKLQSVVLKQSLYQQRKNLATLVLYTAGGSISIPYISLEAARQIINYSAYQVEHQNRAWM